jgi:signal transduction histidine kinase
MDQNQENSTYLQRATVLYVEDDNDVREQLVRFLRHRVGRLLLACDGTQGLEVFREQRPQIVITDIQMPSMDGLQMARQIRELDPSVPIIVTTAFEQTDYLLRSIDIGVDKYVTKPINVDRLSRSLFECARRLRAEELLERQRALEAEARRVKHLEAMGVMAGGMAHDFNNLLQVILGYVSLAQAHAEPGSKVREMLNRAETSFATAIDLGQRLRILGKGNDAVVQAAPLGELIAGVVSAELKGSGVLPEFELAPDLPPACFDEQQMLQVFRFLSANALDAMPEGGRVRVSARAETLPADHLLPLAAGDYLHISFQDTGKGITPENLPLIFDPYFTTKELGCQKGMGLSLALCHAIIWKHNGLISAESPPGEGAAFHIYLPVAQRDEQQ